MIEKQSETSDFRLFFVFGNGGEGMIYICLLYTSDIRIFDTEIPNSIRIDESQSMGEYIAEYEPNNKVAMAYDCLLYTSRCV